MSHDLQKRVVQPTFEAKLEVPMNKSTLRDELMRLPADERLKFGEALWDSLIADVEWMPTPAQLAEARRRLEEYRRDPTTAIPAEKVLAGLRSRFG
jgi:putative addiction module component (TIGR02574 family)